VCRIAVVLDVFSSCRIGQPVLESRANLSRHSGERLVLHFEGCRGRGQRIGKRLYEAGRDETPGGAGDELGFGLEGDDGVRFVAEHALEGRRGVEARCYGAAEGLDLGDGFLRGPRYYDVDRASQLVGVLSGVSDYKLESSLRVNVPVPAASHRVA
jgi:hypothetical protein